MSTAIVTGASRGFGLALATDLSATGWNLVIDGRSEPSLAIARETLTRVGSGVVRVVVGDVADPSHQAELVDAAVEIGGFRLLVNNASDLGATPLPHLVDYPIEPLRRVVEVNLVAPLALIQSSLPHIRSNRGVVINITSDAAVEAYEGWGGYGASKAALEQISHVLSLEEPELRVYWFDPGDMRTQMHQDAFPGEDISDRPLPESRVPALIGLIGSDAPSGRFTASQLLDEVAS
ncbi:MAG: SDR family oxidoreductase [Acidimicrobiia bacterium]|nr:SDR family oxidoreductase [Acidimicrobiia bacterium]